MSSDITTLAGFLIEVQRLLDGDDVSTTDITTATLTRNLRVAEKRIYREAKTRFNEKAFSAVTTSGNLATIPTDYKAPSILYFDGNPLEPVSEEWLIRYMEDSPGGSTEYFCEAGTSFRFAPSIADATTLNGRYFYERPALSDATIASNALFQEADDLFIYATLVEAAGYFGLSARMPEWEMKYQQVLQTLNGMAANVAFGAGKLQRKQTRRLA